MDAIFFGFQLHCCYQHRCVALLYVLRFSEPGDLFDMDDILIEQQISWGNHRDFAGFTQ